MKAKHHYERGQFSKEMLKNKETIARAATKAARDVAQSTTKPGMRTEIARAGFGRRWQNSANTIVYPKTGVSTGPAIFAYSKINYAGIFESDSSISGRPYLWLPTDAAPKSINGFAATPENFAKFIGPLHTIKAAGKAPMLAAYAQGKAGAKTTIAKLRRGAALSRLGVTRGRAGRYGGAGIISVPMFVGVRSVHMRRRFNFANVWQKSLEALVESYDRNVAGS